MAAGGMREAGVAPLGAAIERVARLRHLRPLAIAVSIAALIAGVAGGAGEPSPLFVATNAMAQARAHATATLLPNGKVFFAGGQDPNGVAQSGVEVYDPASGQFTFVGLMSSARRLHTATLMDNGNVLIAGGIDNKGNVLNSAEIFDPVSQTLTLLASAIHDSRASHSATMLDNGQVLIAGGQDATAIVNTAEIYDPTQAQFICVGGVSATPPLCSPSMNDSRMGHTATLLGDGSVLVVGGEDNSGLLTNSSERFMPADPTNAGSGVFKSGGLMSDVRFGHTAALLNDGTVLIAGGNDGFDVVPTAEIYNPTTSQFALTGSSGSGATIMTTPRANHTATLLSDGTVALVGGVDNSGNSLASADIYDPGNGTFSALATRMSQARAFHTANLLASGLVLIAGGVPQAGGPLAVNEAELLAPTPGFFVPNGAMVTARQFHTASTVYTGLTIVAGGQNALGPLASTEVYDGTVFRPGPNLSTQRSFHTATLFPEFLNGGCACNDQRVLFAGGVDAAGNVHADADLYDTFANTILQGVLGGFSLNQMSHPRLGHTSTVLLITGMALYAGGMTSNGSVLNNADIFNPSNGIFSASAGTMASSRVFHTATQLLDGPVLLAGGRDTNGNILKSAESYNPVADAFTSLSATMTDAREFHTATLLNSGQVLIAGGVDNNGATPTAELFNPSTLTFTAVGRMAVARYFHSAVLLPDGEVLIAGGEGNNNLVVNEAEIYSPETASFRPAAGLMLSPRFGQAATMLLNGMVLFSGGADNRFNVTSSSELYDPPSGPAPAGALVSVSKLAKAAASPGSLVNAGDVQVTNLSGSAEGFSEVTIASSQAAIFSRLTLSGQVVGKSPHRQVETAMVKKPGATQTFIFRNPLTVPPGGTVKFTLTGTLGSLRKAGATPSRPVRSIQTLTALGVSTVSGPMQVQGLPTGFGVVTLR